MLIARNGRMDKGGESVVVGGVGLADPHEFGDAFVASALGREHEGGGAGVLGARVMGVGA